MPLSSRMVRDYMMGERRPMNDLMAWNVDATRLPYKMHSEYLRHLFLDNDLAEGRFAIDDTTVALSDIRAPIFAVGTVRDHVSPWRSTYKIHLQTDTEVTYLLTTGGHNAGIVSEPGHERRNFQVMTKKPDDRYFDPDTFIAKAPRKEGSWWPEWVAWLDARSGVPVAPPGVGAPSAGFTPLAEDRALTCFKSELAYAASRRSRSSSSGSRSGHATVTVGACMSHRPVGHDYS